jgi:Reverse transcriptase (RNA-dependent DNA polymerase)
MRMERYEMVSGQLSYLFYRRGRAASTFRLEDTLAPYLFVIVVDYVMRVALADQSLGLKITNKVGTTTRIKIPTKYTTDLDFADDIMLISDDAINSQKQLDSVDIMARKVGLKINTAKTEFMMVEN